MDTNAEQFARMGNPWWDGYRDDPNLPTRASRKIRRAAPNMAKEKPQFREEGYVKRGLSAEDERRARFRRALAEDRRALRQMSIRSTGHGSDRPLLDPQTLHRADPAANWRHANRAVLAQLFDVVEARAKAERAAAAKAERDAERREANFAAVMRDVLGD